MRKLSLDFEGLVVETFDVAGDREGAHGTVHGHVSLPNGCATIDIACTRDDSCYWETCAPQPTNDPRLRQCVTPYVECDTVGWTCNFACGGPGITSEC